MKELHNVLIDITIKATPEYEEIELEEYELPNCLCDDLEEHDILTLYDECECACHD